MLKFRSVLVLSLASSLLTFAGSASAAGNQSNPQQPQGSDFSWQIDPVASPFAYSHFDGAYFEDNNNPGADYSGKVYFLGGQRSDGTMDGSIWEFNPFTDTYTQTTATMPTPVADYTIAVLDDSMGRGLYVFGGLMEDGMVSTGIQVYYPASNSVVTLTDDPFPGTVNGSPVLADGVVVLPDKNQAYVIGGYAPGVGVSAETWMYDPQGAIGSRWNTLPPLIVARGYLAAAKVNDLIYAIGGDTWNSISSSLTPSPAVERLDTDNSTAGWTSLPNLPVTGVPGCDAMRAWGFNSQSAFHERNTILVVGCGQADQPPLRMGFLYDLPTNSWSQPPVDSLNIARSHFAGALVAAPIGTDQEKQYTRTWVFGGMGTDGNNLTSAESKQYRLSPTAVNLTDFSTGNVVATWLPALAGLGLLALLAGMLYRQRRRVQQ